MLYKYFGMFAGVQMQSRLCLWTGEARHASRGLVDVKVNVNEAT